MAPAPGRPPSRVAARPRARGAARGLVPALVSACWLASGSRAGAVDGSAIAYQPVVAGIPMPTCIANAGDGSGRLFLCEQGGRIRILAGGTLLAAPFLDISSRVSCCDERGLLSVAFPPDYAEKGHFYVDYTDANGDTVVARFRASADPDAADAASEETVIRIAQPYANHNGGQLAFGPDGYLYIGMGDGGSGGDPGNRAQNPAVLLGKLLRLDVESGASPYAIPPGNPFRNRAGYRPEIWALGLRNPWRFSFDRGTGDLWIGDVGQDLWEEIDRQRASSGGGENYGWRIMEGYHCFDASSCNQAGLVQPVAEYGHGQECSVTGGYVYRGSAFPRLLGAYFYGDYCSGRVWTLRRDGASWLSTPAPPTPYAISTFGEDEAGDLYLGDYDGGGVFRIVDTAPGCALGCAAAVPDSALPGSVVGFAGAAAAAACTGAPSYEWDFGDGTPAASAQNANHAYATSGAFVWRLTVRSGDSTCTASGEVTVPSRLRRRLLPR